METRDPGLRGNRCRENVSLPGQAGPAPGDTHPCSKAGNTPTTRRGGGYMMEEKRGFTIQGCKYHLTLTELRNRLDGTPTKHVLAVWDQGTCA